MIRINLLPHKKTRPAEKGVQKLRMVMTVLTVIVVVVLGYWFYSLASTLGELREKERLTNRQLQGLKAKLKEVEGYEKSRAEFEQKLKTIQELEKRKLSLTPMLNEINALTGKDVWLTNLSLQGLKFNIDGMCLADRRGIDRFVQRLEASPVFDGITLVESKDAPPGPRGAKAYSFKLTGKLSGLEPQTPPAPAENKAQNAPPPAPALQKPAAAQQAKPAPPQPKPAQPQPAAPKK